MPKNTKNKSNQIMFRLDDATLRRLDARAKVEKRTRSDTVRQAVDAYLSQETK